MSEIIPFPERKKEVAQEKIEGLDKDHLADMLWFLTDFAKVDPKSMDQRNIDVRMKGLKNVTTDWLVERVNESTRNDWRSRPTFYHAVVAELQIRNLLRS